MSAYVPLPGVALTAAVAELAAMDVVVRGAEGGTVGYWLRSLFCQAWCPSKTEAAERLSG